MSRSFDDLPPIATDDELIAWAHELTYGTSDDAELDGSRPQVRPARPLVATRDNDTLTLEELLLDIETRATEVYERAHA